MPSRPAITLLVALLSACACASSVTATDPATHSPEQVEFFETRIRPVLVEHCYKCHSAAADELHGELMLDNRAAIQRGGESGKVVVPRDPDASALIVAMRYDNADLQMPPDGKLPNDVITAFERWVSEGAVDPRSGDAPLTTDSILQRAKRHWAFQPPQSGGVTKVGNQQWPRVDVDRFVLARLEESGIAPSPAADPRTLVRRLSFDLIGLPPSYEQVRELESEPTDEAIERLVDQLLESPHFGERWARHWLDLSRYGDTKGYVFREDRKYPAAYKYRDWVIQALNEDMPYDKFLMQQLVADRLAQGDDRSHLPAMGFLTLGRRFINNTHDIIDDRIDVVFRGLMGLTVTCARCHDHKYDPITMHDYYGLYGVFHSSKEQQDKDLPLRLVDKPKPVDVQVFLRGNSASRGDRAERRFLRFFDADDDARFTDGSGRLELARAIASRDNPLTARVFVNRVWAYLMGQPLVRTPSDFGLRSDPPEQQRLLDHLAVTFMDDGWSVKRLIRRIVLSSVYRQRSELREELSAQDPENRLLSRANRRRLDFEAMRDALLDVSGQLDRTVSGPSVRIDTATPSRRRTLYAYIDRQNLPGLFRTFDFAIPDTHSPVRPNTTVPQQALYLMNNNFVQDAAGHLAARTADVSDEAERVRRLFQMAFSREADEAEVRLGLQLVRAPAETGAADNKTNWQRLAHTLLMTNEFLFLD